MIGILDLVDRVGEREVAIHTVAILVYTIVAKAEAYLVDPRIDAHFIVIAVDGAAFSPFYGISVSIIIRTRIAPVLAPQNNAAETAG